MSFGDSIGLEWLIATTLALLAMVVSIWSARSAHKALELTREQTDPIVTADVTALAGEPNWFSVILTLTNRADFPLKAESLSVTRPLGATLLRRQDEEGARSSVNDGRLSPLPLNLATNKVRLSLRAERAGKPRSRLGSIALYGTGEQEKETIYLHVPAGQLPTTARLQLKLVSAEPKERCYNVEIVRELGTE